VYRNPTLLVPGVADRKILEPFYERIANQIRQVDNERIIAIASVTWQDFIPAGFKTVPGGASYANRTALSYHYYSLPNFDIRRQISWRQDDQTRLGNIAGMLTEFQTNPSDTLVTQLDAAENGYAARNSACRKMISECPSCLFFSFHGPPFTSQVGRSLDELGHEAFLPLHGLQLGILQLGRLPERAGPQGRFAPVCLDRRR
jgi:hypothetical protein